MRVAVAGRKGGVGKTTSAVYLSEAAAVTGPTLLVDADPQGSALTWSTSAELAATTIALPTRTLGRELDRLAGAWEHVVIDCPPGDADAGITRAAIAAADVALCPVAATGLELERLPGVLALADEVGTPAVVLLVRVRPTASVAAVVDALAELDVPLLDTRIPLREAVAGAFGARPRQLHGYAEAWEELTRWQRRTQQRKR